MTVYNFTVDGLDGQPVSLDQFRGRCLLIVNVASKCGFAGQYAGLEALHKKYTERGFAVLGFPCNQFLWQEPGDGGACRVTHGVTFPLFAKVRVNGRDTHPLFAFLKHACPGSLGTRSIKWNFTKFMINREGKPVQRMGTLSTTAAIDAQLAAMIDRPFQQ